MNNAPTITTNEVTTFCGWLEGHDWAYASQIALELSIDERTVRALAAGSDGRIISGQKGYKLTTKATSGEIEHAVNWLRSQAKQMSERAAQIEVTAKLSQKL